MFSILNICLSPLLYSFTLCSVKGKSNIRIDIIVTFQQLLMTCLDVLW